jgi:hypothetical protein
MQFHVQKEVEQFKITLFLNMLFHKVRIMPGEKAYKPRESSRKNKKNLLMIFLLKPST